MNQPWVSLLTIDRRTVEMAKKATTKRTPRKHQKRLVKDDGVRTLLARMLTCKETGSVLKAILFAQERDVWRGVVATPPASLLEVVVAEFMRENSRRR
jgi:hypothetical protein